MESDKPTEQEIQSGALAKPTDVAEESPIATRRRPSAWLIALIGVVIVAFDQITKNLVLQNLVLGQTWVPFPDHPELLTIIATMNTGAVCGYFPQTNTLFSFAPLIILAIVLVFYRQQKDPGWLITIGTGLIAGGAIGNLIDRLRLGFVVDFVQISSWPVFNVADASVSTAVVLLLLWSLREESSQSKAEGTGGAAGGGTSWKVMTTFLVVLGVLAAAAIFVCVWLPRLIYR